MNQIAEAVLTDGKKLPYVITDHPPRGGMKYTYFSPDQTYVVQFYNDPRMAESRNIYERLEAIVGRYNPTKAEADGGAKGNDEKVAAYFSQCFCWPMAIVRYPQLGIVCPAYSKQYYFTKDSSLVLNVNGKEKKSNWFTTNSRSYLNASELGDLRLMLKLCVRLAGAVRRMHQAGLCHSDLSNNNVLIDPSSGQCVIIDIDSLVVPGLFPPEVIGTRGYMAPEVLATYMMSRNDPRRESPSVYTDLHSLAVLIYEYLFYRHPLLGPRVYSRDSAEEDDFLALGPMATFIENPDDWSNRPPNLSRTIQDMGPILQSLFLRAFVDGLHEPELRPAAMEWEKGLLQTLDLLYPCANRFCEQKWFVASDPQKLRCPDCQKEVNKSELLKIRLYAPVRGQNGRWMQVGDLIGYDGKELLPWHVNSDLHADEKTAAVLMMKLHRQGRHWVLGNENTAGVRTEYGTLVPKGERAIIAPQTRFLVSGEGRGMLLFTEPENSC